jgi:hypothetical protein
MPAHSSPKNSNTHNFWTIVPKIMEFVFMQSLFRDLVGKKNSKNLKIVWDHTIHPKTSLSPVGTSGPLGVKDGQPQENNLLNMPIVVCNNTLCWIIAGASQWIAYGIVLELCHTISPEVWVACWLYTRRWQTQPWILWATWNWIFIIFWSYCRHCYQ